MATNEEIKEQLRQAQLLREEAERRMFYYVELAVEAGMSWAEIAQCVGVSRQNLHRKYAKRLPAHLKRRSR